MSHKIVQTEGALYTEPNRLTEGVLVIYIYMGKSKYFTLNL